MWACLCHMPLMLGRHHPYTPRVVMPLICGRVKRHALDHTDLPMSVPVHDLYDGFLCTHALRTPDGSWRMLPIHGYNHVQIFSLLKAHGRRRLEWRRHRCVRGDVFLEVKEAIVFTQAS